MNDMLYYVATPYSKHPAGHEAAFHEAARVTASLVDEGYKVFSPIAHTHPIAEYVMSAEKDTTDFWLELDFPLMQRCNGLIVVEMDGWSESRGVTAEIAYFRSAGKPIYYVRPWHDPAILFPVPYEEEHYHNLDEAIAEAEEASAYYGRPISIRDNTTGEMQATVDVDAAAQHAAEIEELLEIDAGGPTFVISEAPKSRAEEAFVRFREQKEAQIVCGYETPEAQDTTNPKDLIGAKKVPLGLLPGVARIAGALAMADGAAKYGPYNWRDKAVRASVYLDAIERHLIAFRDGEDYAVDSDVSHLGHIIACCAILLDADGVGQLVDDRPVDGPTTDTLDFANAFLMSRAEAAE